MPIWLFFLLTYTTFFGKERSVIYFTHKIKLLTLFTLFFLKKSIEIKNLLDLQCSLDLDILGAKIIFIKNVCPFVCLFYIIKNCMKLCTQLSQNFVHFFGYGDHVLREFGNIPLLGRCCNINFCAIFIIVQTKSVQSYS